MKKPSKPKILKLVRICLTGIALFGFASTLAINKAQSEPSTAYEPPISDNEFYDTLPGGDKRTSILDATNPMELMNRLQRASAMNNATSPSDAIDQALKALDQNTSKINRIEP